MSVYIRGMEMPKCCWDCACYNCRVDDGYYDYEVCRVSGTVFNDGYASVTGHKDKINPFKERLGNCPLIPVPDHGRLIDADALIELLKPAPVAMETEAIGTWGEIWKDECWSIDHSPVIIPADGKEGAE